MAFPLAPAQAQALIAAQIQALIALVQAGVDADRVLDPLRQRAPPRIVVLPPGGVLAVAEARSVAPGYFEMRPKGRGAVLRRAAAGLPGNSALRRHGNNGHHLSQVPAAAFVGGRQVDGAAHVYARSRPGVLAPAAPQRPPGAHLMGRVLAATLPPGVTVDEPGVCVTLPPPGNWPASQAAGRMWCGCHTPRQAEAVLWSWSHFTEVQLLNPGIALMPV